MPIVFISALLRPVLAEIAGNIAALEASTQHAVEFCRACFTGQQKRPELAEKSNKLLSLVLKKISEGNTDCIVKRQARLLSELSVIGSDESVKSYLAQAIEVYKNRSSNSNAQVWCLALQLLALLTSKAVDSLLKTPNASNWALLESAIFELGNSITNADLQMDVETLEIVANSLIVCLPRIQGTKVSIELCKSLLDYFFEAMETASDYVYDASMNGKDEGSNPDFENEMDCEIIEDETGDLMDDDSMEQVFSWRYKVALLRIIEPCMGVLTKFWVNGHSYLTKVLKTLNRIAIQSPEKSLSSGAYQAILGGLSAYIEQRDHKPRFTEEDSAMISGLLLAFTKKPDDEFVTLLTSLSQTNFLRDLKERDQLLDKLASSFYDNLSQEEVALAALQAWALVISDDDKLKVGSAFMRGVEKYLFCYHQDQLTHHGIWAAICTLYLRCLKVQDEYPKIVVLTDKNPAFNELQFWRSVLLWNGCLMKTEQLKQTANQVYLWVKNTPPGRGTNDVLLEDVASLVFLRCIQLQELEMAMNFCGLGQAKIFAKVEINEIQSNWGGLGCKIPEQDLLNIARLVLQPRNSEEFAKLINLLSFPTFDNLDLWSYIFNNVSVEHMRDDLLVAGHKLHNNQEIEASVRSSLYKHYWDVLRDAEPNNFDDVWNPDFLKKLKSSNIWGSQTFLKIFDVLLDSRYGNDIALRIVQIDASLLAHLPESNAQRVSVLIRRKPEIARRAMEEIFKQGDTETIHAGVMLSDGTYPAQVWSSRFVILEILRHKCTDRSIENDPEILKLSIQQLPFQFDNVEHVSMVAHSLRILIAILNEAPVSSINLVIAQIPDFIEQIFSLVKSSESYVKKIELGAGVIKTEDATIETRRLGLIVMSHIINLIGINGLRRAVAERSVPVLATENHERIVERILDAVYYGIGDEDDIMNLNGVQIVQRILNNEKDFWKTLKIKSKELLDMLQVCQRYFIKLAKNQEEISDTKIQSRLESISQLTNALEHI
eukprot:Gregarina_sp_Poly_1__840@NODE_11_length_23386_cov_122_075861_g9_i0_p3_GENE_NODE_11_length_23386_cov_122_075861_g9_i0NODE_11_length_23386_cov_122_075861_g9_i0_p3_ORF_typecomplete_len999_score183_45RTP1_C1/PF10363_9/75RTP1_C1/PF10363_9/5_8e02RTP1_C1/PF10363_9/1_5e04RTP1_C1/PF10363_9/2_4e03RTP1_C1/PF10363_9/2_6IFRD/PF05004_13/6_7IFRD/PF05004_13/0_77IFRD/PF05004_13/2e03RYDR_ITPR/PF01365_21/4_3e03RYDR_ITPR/PF01365_21/1_2RYDR_ITPR/PF01365_21/3e03RYDR_ITPR/PF01365_21/1_2e03_NODE_11_length_23386_cov_122